MQDVLLHSEQNTTKRKKRRRNNAEPIANNIISAKSTTDTLPNSQESIVIEQSKPIHNNFIATEDQTPKKTQSDEISTASKQSAAPQEVTKSKTNKKIRRKNSRRRKNKTKCKDTIPDKNSSITAGAEEENLPVKMHSDVVENKNIPNSSGLASPPITLPPIKRQKLENLMVQHHEPNDTTDNDSPHRINSKKSIDSTTNKRIPLHPLCKKTKNTKRNSKKTPKLEQQSQVGIQSKSCKVSKIPKDISNHVVEDLNTKVSNEKDKRDPLELALSSLILAEESAKTSENAYKRKRTISEISSSSDELDDIFLSSDRILTPLIDEAARERWELSDIGRLVRLFTARWNHDSSKTTLLLLDTCPELVNVEFLEGLAVTLTCKQLLKIFMKGPGSTDMVIHKVASALENDIIKVGDEALKNYLVENLGSIESNEEVEKLLIPLIESLSSIRSMARLVKAVGCNWHVKRLSNLIQRLILLPVMDDLDGKHEDILNEIPSLEGLLDFPKRLRDDDADENGNLIGLIASDDDVDAEDLDESMSEEEFSGSDKSEIGNDENEGETDSEDEANLASYNSGRGPNYRGRPKFILDEADEGSEDSESNMESDE